MSFNLFRKFYRISIYNSRIINLSEIILVIPQPDLLSHSKVLSFVKFQNCDNCSLNSYPWCKVLIHIRTLLAVPMNLLRTLYGSQNILPFFPTTLSSLIFKKLMGCPHMIYHFLMRISNYYSEAISHLPYRIFLWKLQLQTSIIIFLIFQFPLNQFSLDEYQFFYT